MKLDENECLALWIAMVRKDPTEQYTFNGRKQHIETLMEYFRANDVDKESAQMMKRKVVEALVTKEGMRGKGKHTNWKENAEQDYDDAIQIEYVMPNANISKLKPIKTAQGYDPKIVAWVKAKFGEELGEDMIIAAHQPLHTLRNMFLRDTFPKQLKRGVKP